MILERSLKKSWFQQREATAMTPLPAGKALDAFFLEARSKILDLAAILDRIERGQDAAGLTNDTRLGRIAQAVAILHVSGVDRAEKVQQIFSLDYDPEWKRPTPRI
jgi:hypothetical protein